MNATQELVEVPRHARGWQETVAIVLLLAGGFFWGAGWLVGVILLWLSDVWSTRDKLIGTFVIPGGLAASSVYVILAGLRVTHTAQSCVGIVGGPQTCQSSGGSPLYLQILVWAFASVVVAAPVWTAVYLARRSRP